MKELRRKSKESGMALLLAIFTLLLLTAMGLTLLCAADLETNIAANYRDKQVAMYGALSGLQEARDRLDPSLCDPNAYPTIGTCPGPAIEIRNLALPTTTNGSIVYVLNPTNGETIAPWDSSNPYFDTELCKENILGLTNAAGDTCPVASTSVPSGSAWYTTYNDTQAFAGMYQTGSGTLFPTPLYYKWVRISVKTDKMTPAYVSYNPTGSTVECWDGHHQVPAAAPLYNSNCGALDSVELYNGGTVCSQNGTVCTFNPPIGTGYSSPVVTISGGGGSGATATAQLTTAGGGQVTAVTMGNKGSAYTLPPTVSFSGGGGSGATATANLALNGAPVASLADVTQTNPIGCYATTPSVTITSADGVGSGATATANMTGPTCIAKFSLTYTSGNCSQTGSGVPLSTGTGGFAATVTVNTTGHGHNLTTTGFSNVSITNPGSGYTTTPTTLSGLSGCTYTFSYTLGQHIKSTGSFNVTTGGGDYDQNPTVSITAPTSGGPNPPTTTASRGANTAGYVSSISLTNGGSGYTTPPAVTITPAPTDTTGAGATATATVNSTGGGSISSIALTNVGSGYTSNPTLTITDGGGGTGATGVTAKSSAGSSAGRIFVLTALAQTPGKSRSIVQMEAATPPAVPFSMPGALTVDAPSPVIAPPTSNNYFINGQDANSCGETALPPKASIGVTDNPDAPTNPTATACITSMLGGAPNSSCPQASGVKTTNYPGDLASPDVENVYNSLGDLTTPAGCDALASAIAQAATPPNGYTYGNNPSSIHLGSYPSDCPPIVVNGDLTLGPVTGCGVLLVTGNLTMQGNYTWNGPIFVIGSGGSFTGGGGGNGVINGSLFVAQDKCPASGTYSGGACTHGSMLTSLGTPTVSFGINGGGGNGVYYDHCKSDDMLKALGLNYMTPIQALQVLSVRTIY